jgi:hypothetical protein
MTGASLKLDMGCGRRKALGFIGIDYTLDSDADVICDLNRFPYPFKDNSFSQIRAADCLEHLADTVKVMEEIHRISKRGSVVDIASPHFSSHNLYTDFTHKKAFAVRSFDFFSQQKSQVRKYMQTTADFEIVKKWIEPNPFVFNFRGRIVKVRNRLLGLVINLSGFTQDVYERFFAFMFTSEGVYFRLKAVKPG